MRVAEIAGWLATNLWFLLLVVPAQYLVAVVGDRFSERIRAQSDRRLGYRVTRAATRLPVVVRAAYEREWQAELHHVLHGEDARPVIRLWHGLRYARGLRSAARSIARSHEGRRTVLQRLSRSVARSVRSVALLIALLPVAALLLALVAVITVEVVVVAVAAVFVTPIRIVFRGGTVIAVYRRTVVTGLRCAPIAWGGWESGPDPGDGGRPRADRREGRSSRNTRLDPGCTTLNRDP